MATRSGVGGLAVGSSWHGAVWEILLDLRGFMYGPLGVQRSRGSDLLVVQLLNSSNSTQGYVAAAYRRDPYSSSTD